MGLIVVAVLSASRGGGMTGIERLRSGEMEIANGEAKSASCIWMAVSSPGLEIDTVTWNVALVRSRRD